MTLLTRQTRPYARRERRWSRLLLLAEDAVKVPLFGCQRCGECILSHTGFVCSQQCPKRIRNGPCGGTGPGGTCEVYPDRRCVWVRIHRRAQRLRRLELLRRIEKIHNWDLERTSAWWNVFTRRIDPPLFRLTRRRRRALQKELGDVAE
jgi:methylenetetrahydrofolate reductase (NADPH)